MSSKTEASTLVSDSQDYCRIGKTDVGGAVALEADDNKRRKNPILHVIVVGFHHKKGCQVEYSYPPLIDGNSVDSHELPAEWHHLPSLALPDGAHNYTKDTIFFHLPSRDGEYSTVYGVSCYQQMDSKDLISRSEDVTRNTVQKSVCVLSKLPLYGLIQTKLELITHAYFDERDFSKVELLIDTYRNLSTLLTDSQTDSTKIYLGLPARDLVIVYRHKILILFKLLLLERRVLFTGKPVQELCQTMLGVMSLFPGLIEHGLKESACYSPHRQISPTLKFHQMESEVDGFLEVSYHKNSNCDTSIPTPRPSSRSTSLASEPENQTIVRDENNDEKLKLESDPVGSAATSSPDLLVTTATCLAGTNCSQNTKSQTDVTAAGSSTKSTVTSTTAKSTVTSSTTAPTTTATMMQHDAADKDMLNNNNQNSRISLFSTKTSLHTTTAATTTTTTTMVNDSQCKKSQDDGNTTKASLAQPAVTDTDQPVVTDTDQGRTRSSEKRLRVDLDVCNSETLPEEDLHRSESIEELDSPESISKIDREDCFSWENDRIVLEINDEHDPKVESERSPLPGSGESGVSGRFSTTHTTTVTTSSVACDKSTGPYKTDSLSRHPDGDSSCDNPPTLQTQTNENAADNHPLSPSKKDSDHGMTKKPLSLDIKHSSVEDSFTVTTTLHSDDYGLPLAIFSKGCLCHPYLSLQFFDLLEDVNVRGFVIGATNILFKQRKHLTDVVVEVNDGRIDFHDNELKKQLNLTTADLRFADFLVKVVTENKTLFLDGTEWEGGDEWVRLQFKEYILSLLASTLGGDEKLMEDFNLTFIQAWKTTHNYRLWNSCKHPVFNSVSQSHPFQGHLNMSDLRVRLSHTMQSTEKGKKLNAAVSQTGKYVVQTGKVFGGAITSAKSAMSSWFSSFTTEWKHPEKEEDGGSGDGDVIEVGVDVGVGDGVVSVEDG
ncbi:late secretory pathway protein AVL9 homolog, partial [Argonauta hians]